ncbi:MAG: AraC family transcriptional regulator [Paenibacillus sp.]|nr:AraC family transcriptional regulator [Paenibacillus sp.]
MRFFKANIANPIEFISGGQFVSEIPWIHSKRNIDSFEIIIGVNKTLYIQQEDIQYEVKPGDVLLLPPGHTHQGYMESEEHLSFYWFHFHFPAGYRLIDVSSMNEDVSIFRKDPDSRRNIADIYIPLFSAPPCIERVNILFHQLMHVVNSNYYTNYSGYYLLTSLLIELSEQTITNFYMPRNKSAKDLNLEKIMEWTRIHAMGDITVALIAKKFNYNKDYLSRFFKQRTGINLQEYIHLQKISKAKDLLSRSMQSIKEVSMAIGIRDEKYFMKLFKKYENMTPTEFRQAFTKTHMNNR